MRQRRSMGSQAADPGAVKERDNRTEVHVGDSLYIYAAVPECERPQEDP